MHGMHAPSTAAPSPTLPLLLPAGPGDKEHREVISGMRRMAPQVVVFTSVAIGGSHQRSASPGEAACTCAVVWQG